MPQEKACRNCRYITRESVCPVCGSKDLTMNWSGQVIILDVENSEIAKALGVKVPGRYAINVV
ncbi:MAG: transcription elongation factor subunit Spt4 [Nitrososphaeria archaeon]|jgi:DNA-directed RNA polymerase subunit E"